MCSKWKLQLLLRKTSAFANNPPQIISLGIAFFSSEDSIWVLFKKKRMPFLWCHTKTNAALKMCAISCQGLGIQSTLIKLQVVHDLSSIQKRKGPKGFFGDQPELFSNVKRIFFYFLFYCPKLQTVSALTVYMRRRCVTDWNYSSLWNMLQWHI